MLWEKSRQVALPQEYREFISRVGNGASGPPEYGLLPLGEICADLLPAEKLTWRSLEGLRRPFPFTKPWVWEEGELSSEGSREQVGDGSIMLGTDGCGIYWHLIVSGPERGTVWQLTGEGIQPLCPKRNFGEWVSDWLEGLDPFREYK